MFSCEYCKTFKNTSFYRTPKVTASGAATMYFSKDELSNKMNFHLKSKTALTDQFAKVKTLQMSLVCIIPESKVLVCIIPESIILSVNSSKRR